MKVLAFNGSPRMNEGLTDMILSRFMDGAKEAGAETETIYLSEKKITYCSGCFRCWFVHPGSCRYHDDMEELLIKSSQSDILVYASPVYVDGFTAQMKTMFDRSITAGQPFIVQKDGHSRHPGQEKFKRKGRAKMVLLSTCGFGEIDNFAPMIVHMEAIAKNMGGELLKPMLRPMGGTLIFLKESAPEKVDEVMDAFYQGGMQAVKDGAISEEVQEAAAKPLMSVKEYAETANRFFTAELEKNKADSAEA